MELEHLQLLSLELFLKAYSLADAGGAENLAAARDECLLKTKASGRLELLTLMTYHQRIS